MRDLKQRVERLERELGRRQTAPFRMTLRLIDLTAEGAGPAPWEPTWAEAKGTQIQREAGETVEAFEQRAAERFPVGLCLMGCK